MKDEVDIDPVGKSLPIRGTKLPGRAAEVQHDVQEITHLDPSYSYKQVDYLNQSAGVQSDMVQEVRQHEGLDTSMRVEQYREARESFVTMMEIRNVLVEAYDDVRRMRAQI